MLPRPDRLSSSPSLDVIPDSDTRAAVVSVSTEGDDYSRSVEGVALGAVRMGRGKGPNIVESTQVGDTIANSNTIRTPMATWATIGDNRILAAVVKAAPPGAIWCGIEIEPGMVVMYGPEAEHTGANPSGLSFAFTLVQTEQLRESADRLRIPLNMPSPGQVHALRPTAQSKALFRTVSTVTGRASSGMAMDRLEAEVVNACLTALSDDERLRRVGARRAIDSRHVTRACIDLAESTGQMPSIAEMCQAAGVSERRLFGAFNDVYGLPPRGFFRGWGLDMARRRLLTADPRSGDTVTRIALDTGFNHLSRFAMIYRQAHGEQPSTTLTSRP